MSNVTISDSIKYIGVDDTKLDLFESQYICLLYTSKELLGQSCLTCIRVGNNCKGTSFFYFFS